jgi:hypothetical protein
MRLEWFGQSAVFALDGLRICHMGDFGQAALRPEQRRAAGRLEQPGASEVEVEQLTGSRGEPAVVLLEAPSP